MSEAKNEASELMTLLCDFDGKNPVIEVFHEEPDNTFICAVVGAITIDSLQRIDYESYDVLDRGDGIYRIKCIYIPAAFVDGGLHEGDYWELHVLGYEAIGA